MRKNRRKVLWALLLLFILSGITAGCFAASPVKFKNDFAKKLIKGQGGEAVFDLSIDDEASLYDNITNLFYPGKDGQNHLWRLIRTVSVGMLILFFVWAGLKFLLRPNEEAELKKSEMNLIYILMGAAIIFLATWLLWTALDLGTVEGLSWANGLLERAESNVLLVVLGFLKAAAFFMAIVFIGFYGFRMMQALDHEDKQKAARTGILNVVIALIFIKVIDYIYFIAQQKSFGKSSVELIVQSSKFLAYLAGIVFVITLIYAWYLYLTANWNDDQIKKATNIIKTVFIVILMLLMFLLVIYQVVKDIVA